MEEEEESSEEQDIAPIKLKEEKLNEIKEKNRNDADSSSDE